MVFPTAQCTEVWYDHVLTICWHTDVVKFQNSQRHFVQLFGAGYETFLTQIRNRIVCAEDDVQEVLAQTCDSMKDGPDSKMLMFKAHLWRVRFHRYLPTSNRILSPQSTDIHRIPSLWCQDGPFCRALPELGVGQPRHQPFTLDSIVPQHLFGDPRASMERLGPGKAGAGSDAAQTEQVTKQATAVLNRFLEHFSKIKEATWQKWINREFADICSEWVGSLMIWRFFVWFVDGMLRSILFSLFSPSPHFLLWVHPTEVSLKSAATEGRLDLGRLAMGGKLAMPRSYSRGLPNQVYATWEGPWQVEPVHWSWKDQILSLTCLMCVCVKFGC